MKPRTPAQVLRPRASASSPKRKKRLAEVRKPEQSSLSMDDLSNLPRLLTTDEVAAALNVHPRTLRRMRNRSSAGFPEPLLIGRAVRWRGEQIRQWIGGRQ